MSPRVYNYRALVLYLQLIDYQYLAPLFECAQWLRAFAEMCAELGVDPSKYLKR